MFGVIISEMNHTFSGGGVVLNSQGQVLIVSQHGTSWSLPKGHIEKDEDPQMAAQREIKEESGIKDLKFIKELGSYDRYRITQDGGEDKNELKTITMFLFRTDHEAELRPTDPENPEARWVEPENVSDLLSHPKDKEFFKSVIKQVRE